MDSSCREVVQRATSPIDHYTLSDAEALPGCMVRYRAQVNLGQALLHDVWKQTAM